MTLPWPILLGAVTTASVATAVYKAGQASPDTRRVMDAVGISYNLTPTPSPYGASMRGAFFTVGDDVGVPRPNGADQN